MLDKNLKELNSLELKKLQLHLGVYITGTLDENTIKAWESFCDYFKIPNTNILTVTSYNFILSQSNHYLITRFNDFIRTTRYIRSNSILTRRNTQNLLIIYPEIQLFLGFNQRLVFLSLLLDINLNLIRNDNSYFQDIIYSIEMNDITKIPKILIEMGDKHCLPHRYFESHYFSS